MRAPISVQSFSISCSFSGKNRVGFCCKLITQLWPEFIKIFTGQSEVSALTEGCLRCILNHDDVSEKMLHLFLIENLLQSFIMPTSGKKKQTLKFKMSHITLQPKMEIPKMFWSRVILPNPNYNHYLLINLFLVNSCQSFRLDWLQSDLFNKQIKLQWNFIFPIPLLTEPCNNLRFQCNWKCN